MSNEPKAADGWRKLSEVTPRDAMFPPKWVWLWAPSKDNPAGVRVLWELRCGAPEGAPEGGGWTHWQPAIVPDMPKIEPTQDDIDARAYSAWRDDRRQPQTRFPSEAWHAAIAWEREQVRALLCHAGEPPEKRDMYAAIGSDQWHKLCERLGLKLD